MKEIPIQLHEETLAQVDALAKDLQKTRSWVIEQAVCRLMDYDEWFRREVKAGLQEVERGEIADDEAVQAVFQKWGVNAH